MKSEELKENYYIGFDGQKLSKDEYEPFYPIPGRQFMHGYVKKNKSQLEEFRWRIYNR